VILTNTMAYISITHMLLYQTNRWQIGM